MSLVLRRVDVSGLGGQVSRNEASLAEPRSELAWVPIDKLVIDEAYQRPID